MTTPDPPGNEYVDIIGTDSFGHRRCATGDEYERASTHHGVTHRWSWFVPDDPEQPVLVTGNPPEGWEP